jgi:hypothetical protein
MPTEYCPKCINILDISKTLPKNKLINLNVNEHDITPTTVSITDNDTESDIDSDTDSSIDEEEKELEEQNKLIEQIINKFTNDETVTDTELNDIKIDKLIKHKLYIKLDKKTKAIIQDKLHIHTEKLDDATNAYYICKNCYYSKVIEPETLILTRANGTVSDNYINLDKLKNRIHSNILPYTRDYICINDKCPTNTKGEIKEAVFFRLNGSLQVWYACKICESYWKGQ